MPDTVPETAPFDIAIHTSGIRSVQARVDGGPTIALGRDSLTGDWVGQVPTGARYVVAVDGDRLALDPRASEVWFPPGHSRQGNKRTGTIDPEDFPRAVAMPWPHPRPQRHTTRPLVVYEAHVRGLSARRSRADAGTFRAAIDELPRLADLGVSVLELLPVHQYDPDEGNYWGYMPLVFGAVHRQYASGDHAADELADLVSAAHDRDIEVWLDVVVNHTTESDRTGPYYSLRILDEREYYVVQPDGTYLDDSGTGNTIDAYSPQARRLIMEALDRLADLGVDGFRFDLAAVLARDPDFVRSIGDWGERRGVRLIAEPWDMARYLLGPDFPDQRWMQWNGQFRDDVRGFLRGEPGMVPRMVQRLAGSATRVVNLPARYAAETVNRTVENVQQGTEQTRDKLGAVAGKATQLTGAVRDALTVGRNASLERAETNARTVGDKATAKAVHETRRDLGALSASELPVKDYDKLSVADSVKAVKGLDKTVDVRTVIAYEEANAARTSVVSAAQTQLAAIAKQAVGIA